MASAALLNRAAALLEREAGDLAESCQGLFGALWACGGCQQSRAKCSAQLDHEELERVARMLRASAKRAIRRGA